MKSMKSAWLVCIIVLTGNMMCFADTNSVTLKDAFAKVFLVGAALSDNVVSGRDPNAAAIVERHFSTITSENMMKWQHIHPRPNDYNFAPADRFVEFGQKNKMFIVGHTLVWQHQTPGWVFKSEDSNELSKEELLERMKEHISTVVGRYKGRVKGWDVVNEALTDTGQFQRTRWFRIIGEDFIAKAFEYAHQADPDAELYYNDYSLDVPAKREACVRLVKNLKAKGLRIDGVGIQGHWALGFPSRKDIETFINAMAAVGVKVMVTELDIDVLPSGTRHMGADISLRVEMQEKLNPYVNGLPDDVQKKLADRYTDIFAVLVKHKDTVSRVTFWGVYDKTSWLNDWPVRGRTSYPLLFDRNYQPKPAFFAVLKAAEEK